MADMADLAHSTFVAAQTRRRRPRKIHRSSVAENTLLHCAQAFLVIARVAGLLGFSGLATSAAGIAKVLFPVFVVPAVLSAVAGLFNH